MDNRQPALSTGNFVVTWYDDSGEDGSAMESLAKYSMRLPLKSAVNSKSTHTRLGIRFDSQQLLFKHWQFCRHVGGRQRRRWKR